MEPSYHALLLVDERTRLSRPRRKRLRAVANYFAQRRQSSVIARRMAILPLVLASASPRRLELLYQVGVRPEVRPADIDETQAPDEPALAYVCRLAEQKARRVLAEVPPGRLVLGADTIVHVDAEVGPGLILGKPTDEADARAMLARLSGGSHRVVTGYYLCGHPPVVARGRSVATTVTFRVLSDAEIDGYVRSGEWRGKAGGYAIQGLAGAMVSSVSGSYTNVVGLPVCEVLEDLRALGGLSPDWPAS